MQNVLQVSLACALGWGVCVCVWILGWGDVDPVISTADLVSTQFIQWTEAMDRFPDAPTADAASARDTAVGTPNFGDENRFC